MTGVNTAGRSAAVGCVCNHATDLVHGMKATSRGYRSSSGDIVFMTFK